MAKKGNVRRISEKKRNKPKVRFSIWMLIIIFSLSFIGCFGLYMAAANMDDDFFTDEFGTVIEEATESASGESSADDSEEPASGDSDVQESSQAAALNPVPESAAMDMAYMDNCCLITDKFLSLKDYGFKDVIGSENLTAASVNETKVESNYGTVTVYETLKIKKPMNAYIMLGSDIGVSSTDEMISAYTTLVTNLKAAMPEMKIYIMQLPPVFDNAEMNTVINDYNARLLSLADTLGVYCLDTNTGFKNNDGNLRDDYKGEEGTEYASKFFDDIIGYILTHTV